MARVMPVRAACMSQLPLRTVAVAATFGLLLTVGTPAFSALTLGVAAMPVLAQSSTHSAQAAIAPATRPPLPAKPLAKPDWRDLTPAQQVSLQPLTSHWSSMGDVQRRKWIAIAANYPRLSPAEQTKLHSRMTEWASLSQKERAQARLNFAESKQLTPNQKAATWQAYQALSPEEKRKLATSAPARPTGAAAAAKPVPPQKMAAIPVTRNTPQQTPKIPASTQVVNKNTLLPHPPTPLASAPATTQRN